MKKSNLILISILFFLMGCKKKETVEINSLKVSENGRNLEFKNKKPFLYLGCTAWELFHRLNREEADEYLENRALKGFTVIQAVVLAENDGMRIPNAYGENTGLRKFIPPSSGINNDWVLVLDDSEKFNSF